MRNAFPNECHGGEAESGKTLKVYNGNIFDDDAPFDANPVFGFVDIQKDKSVYLPQGKKVKTLSGGKVVDIRDGHKTDFTLVEGEILESVGYSPTPPARPGDLKKATGELLGIDDLKDIKVIVL